jgi:hypothetical protein
MDAIDRIKSEESRMNRILRVASFAGLMLLSAPQISLAQNDPVSITQEAIDPAKLAAATQLLDIVMPPESRDAMIEAIMKPMMQTMMAGIKEMPELKKIFGVDAEVQKIFERFMERQKTSSIAKLQQELPNMMTAMARAYARQFSLQEMADAKAFFATPSGRAYMTKAGGIMADPDIVQEQRSLMSSIFADKNGELAKFKTEIDAYMSSKSKKTEAKRH